MIDPDKTTMQDEISFANIKRYGSAAVNEFIRLIQNGESVKMAEMLVTKTPPRLGINDHYFQRNRLSLLDQFGGSEATMRAWQKAYRERTGEELPADATILRGAARGIGDEDAVITHKHTLADVKKKLAARNLRVEGDFDMEPIPTPPRPQVIRMGADLVENYVDQYITENPDLQQEDRRELREMVIDTHSREVTVSDLNPSGATDFKTLAKKLFSEPAGRPIQITTGS